MKPHDLKETLVQLLAAVTLMRSKDAHGTKASDIRRWAGTFTAKRKPDLAMVLSHFACVSQWNSNGWIWNVVFSHTDLTKVILTSTTLATVTILIWDGSTQPPKEIFKVQGAWSTISCDGSHIAVRDGEDVSIIDTTAQPPSTTECTNDEDPNDSGNIESLCFSADNHTLATGHENGWIKLWRWAGDQWKVGKRFKGGDSRIYSLAFSKDGSRLAFNGEPIKVWDLVDDTVIELEDSEDSPSLAWSPSGDWIVSGTTDGSVKIWSTDRAKITHTFKAHQRRIQCLAFRDDGQVLATGSVDKTIRIWRCDNREKIWEFGTGETVWSLAFSPDGKRLASGGLDGALHLWDLDMAL
ncbi:hypothetical protein ONZ45_g13790 [Pleurotus djamor]|nr:hypothetical protein ONZ45_g13790 [Pleurotus djamor]